MGTKTNDNGPILTLAQLARFARYIIPGLGRANNNWSTRRGCCFFRGIHWDNANNGANLMVGQLVGMGRVIAR